MSNYLAVATVSAALADMLNDAVVAAHSQATAVVGQPIPPEATPDDPQVRVFLYSVQPNGAWRNEDLPSRTSGGRVITRPQAALDLHYLLSFHGDDSELVPQQLLGIVVNELHANPILSRDRIRKVISDNPDDPLGLSDLDEQTEMVRFSPLLLNLEELSKLWSVLFQIPYRLSVAYQASVVLISPDEIPRLSLPVSERQLLVTTIRRPRIERIETVDGSRGPFLVGMTVRIRGVQLRGDITYVWFGGVSDEPDSENVTDREILIEIPRGVRAGLIGVRVEHRFVLDDDPTERPAGQSNIVPITLRPHITSVDADVTGGDTDARTGTLNITVEPAIGVRQRVIVHLTMMGQDPEEERIAYSFADEPRDVVEDPEEELSEETNDLSIPCVGVVAGTYLVRISVDGAESPLERDDVEGSPTFQQYIGPEVVIP
jgi:hypothetical protein